MIRSFGKKKKKVAKAESTEEEKDPTTGRKCFVEIKRMMEAKTKLLTEESILIFMILRSHINIYIKVALRVEMFYVKNSPTC